MNTHFPHFSLYDLASLGTLCIGLMLAALLAGAKKDSQKANRWLSLALTVTVLGTGGLTALLLPALGPLLYLYVRQLTRPEHRLYRKDLLHFSPLLAANWLPSWLVLMVIIIYLFLSHRLIQNFYRQLQPIWMDRPRFAFRRLESALLLLGICCGLSVFYEMGYFAIALVLIGLGIEAILKTASDPQLTTPATDRSATREKARRLKETVAVNRLYEDPELTLTTLALKLQMHPHELSRVINEGLDKNFSDFLNEFRVREVARKIQDPAYNHFTLLGIAYGSGFNSERTFQRVFKELTGKTPSAYKNSLEKLPSIHSLAGLPRLRPVILRPESPPNWAPGKSKRNFMFRNYLKITFRQLLKQKVYAGINIGGFAMGIAACILIALYIRDESSYDRSYPNADRIYRLVSAIETDGKPSLNNNMPAPLAGTYAQNFPEVEKAGRIMSDPEFPGAGSNEVRTAEQVQNTHEDGFAYADQSLLDILQLPMVAGERAHALTDPHTLVISKSKADKYFPGQNAVGKVLYLNNELTKPWRIAGVMQDFPATSHLQYGFLLSQQGVAMFPGEQQNWAANNYDVYVLLRPGTDLAGFEKRSSLTMFQKYILPGMQAAGISMPKNTAEHARLQLQPITDIHLRSAGIYDNYTHGDIRFVWLFAAIALFILIIAGVNFVNLSTARSANRAKEVGLRKVVGSSRLGLMGQFLTESLFYSLLSFILGALLAWTLLPYFNAVAGKTIGMPWLTAWFLPALLLAAALTGLLAGLYPAFYLSGFNPAKVLKGTLSTGSKSSALRNSLVVFQFTTAIVLLVSTLVIYQQLQYLLNKKLGYDKDQVVLLEGTGALGRQVTGLKNELQKLAGVKSVAISDYLPVAGTKRTSALFSDAAKGKTESSTSGQLWQVDPGYLPTMGIKLVSGRNFSEGLAADSQAVVINQALAAQLHLPDPVGKRILLGGQPVTVIGEVADFNFESLRERIYGLAMVLGNSPSLIAVKVNPGNMKQSIDAIAATWRQFAPAQPFRYTFLDARFAAMYADVQRMNQLFTSFAILAIVISCLGLFALAAFLAEQRRKEIGIRKVLGASTAGITSLLSIDFIKLILLSILIASPIAGYAMHQWLEDFTYRISISWWLFAAAGTGALLIALLTISFQSVSAALANPVKSLRSE